MLCFKTSLMEAESWMSFDTDQYIRISISAISIFPKLVAESSQRKEVDEVERSCTECSPSRLMQMVKEAARASANNERSGMHGIDLNPWTSDDLFSSFAVLLFCTTIFSCFKICFLNVPDNTSCAKKRTTTSHNPKQWSHEGLITKNESKVGTNLATQMELLEDENS